MWWGGCYIIFTNIKQKTLFFNTKTIAFYPKTMDLGVKTMNLTFSEMLIDGGRWWRNLKIFHKDPRVLVGPGFSIVD